MVSQVRNDKLRTPWSVSVEPRDWQRHALQLWVEHLHGVVSIVTGGGKTVFAFLCIQEFRKRYSHGRIIVVVPTITLLDQWHIGLQEELGVTQQEIGCFSSEEKPDEPRPINILTINSGRHLVRKLAAAEDTFLIVDECHRAGSPENAKALQGEFVAALGLSATPKREYDAGFEEKVVPVLGSVIFEYDYNRAFEDGIIAPFDLVNVAVELLPHEKTEYDRLSRRAAVLLNKARKDVSFADGLKRVLQMRAAVSANATMRIPVAAKLVEENRGRRTIVFHERIGAAKALHDLLKKRNHSVCLYHSQIAPSMRRDNLRLFRRGVFDVLISCRALDEGMNVPETTVAIIASSTASQRQRIQRLGRVLRPAPGKKKATIYTLFGTEQEHRRLAKEAKKLLGVAEVIWSAGKRHTSV